MGWTAKYREMSRRLWVVAAGFAILLGSSGGASARNQLAAMDARVEISPLHTRFLLDLSDTVQVKLFTLRNPYRVVIDLPTLAWRVNQSPASQHGGIIEGYRYGLFRPDTFRIVLDVSQPVAVKAAFATSSDNNKTHRLTIDLAVVSKAEFDRSYVDPAPVPVAVRPVPRRSPPAKHRTRDTKHIIVIDPGHGGIDPGATGISGVHEKDLTLAAAKELKRQLNASGHYRAILTREDDVFLPLHERVQFARNAHAQLFISLHADTISRRNVTGSSVYTLSEKASDADAAALAADENRADLIAGADLSNYPNEVADILIDLAQRETKNDSVKYAHLLIHQLDKSGRLLEHSLRSAGFAVLKAPDVPSVLLEMGYLSNPREERELRNPRRRATLMAAVKRAIDLYFAERDQLTKS